MWGSGRTHRGNVRSRNEDTIIVEPTLGLYAVLDGMGGHADGNIASRLAGDAIVDCVRQHGANREYTPRELLEFAVDEAAFKVYVEGQGKDEHQRMGTTVVACLVVAPNHVVIGHVGDSRAYHLDGGRLQVLTRDHTFAQQLFDDGVLKSQDELAASSVRHVLTRNLGRVNGERPDIVELQLALGDRLLLCSDGLYTSASAEAIQRVLALKVAPERIADQLIDLALQGKGDDNVSAIVLSQDASAGAFTPMT
jgi:PPM family protein phosphatase